MTHVIIGPEQEVHVLRFVLTMSIIVASAVGCAHNKKVNSQSSKTKISKAVAKNSAAKTTPAKNSLAKNRMIQSAQEKKQFQQKSLETMSQDLMIKSEGVYYSEIITAMDKRKYPVALMRINEVLEKHPNTKRAPRYLFLKTKAYSQMNLLPQAKSVLVELQKKYPQAIESKMAHGWVAQ